jgi:hypothetical protein
VDDKIQAPSACVVINYVEEHQLELCDTNPHDGFALWMMLQVANPIEVGLVGEVQRLYVELPVDVI